MKNWTMLNEALRRTSVRGAVLALAGTLVGCGASDEEGDVQLAVMQDAVQSVWVGSSESTTTTGVNLLKSSSQNTRKGRSTGAIRNNEPNNIRSSCGATFISHRYAVTAAHCVDMYNTTQTFTVEQYNTVNLNLSKYGQQTSVSGTWPNYTRPTKLTSSDGYVVTSYSCRVTRRCRSEFNPVNCPLGDNAATTDQDESQADIALLFCSSRATTGLNWVPVASSDTIPGNLEIWWFHEVVNLATNSSMPYAPYMPNHNWSVYGKYPTNGLENNWHYYQTPSAERHQLLPLASWHTAGNQPYTSNTANQTSAKQYQVTWSNVPVCHGTSGSGVFRAGQDNLLGPVSRGVLQIDGTHALCANMSASPGNQGMGYTVRSATAVFGSLSEVTSDRQ